MKANLDDALQDGATTDYRSVLGVLSGAAGAGKTHVKNLVFDKPPPELRHSTDLAERPMQGIRLTTGEDGEWVEVEDHMQDMYIAGSVAGVEWKKEEKSLISASSDPVDPKATGSENAQKSPTESAQLSEVRERDTPVHAVEQKPLSSACTDRMDPNVSGNQNSQKSPTQSAQLSEVREKNTPVEQKESDSGDCRELPQSVAENKATISSQSPRKLPTSESVQKLKSSIAHHMATSPKISKSDWIHLLDTGGQPEFQEIASLFLGAPALNIFVTKLSEGLDDHQKIEFFVKGKPVGKSIRSPHSNLQLLQRTFGATQCLASSHINLPEGFPKLLVVGTFRDKEMSQFLKETLHEKDQRLIQLLAPGFKKNLVYFDEKEHKLIFPVNAKTPSLFDKKIGKLIRRVMLSFLDEMKPVKTPLAWSMLEQALRKLTAGQGKGYVSTEEALSLAAELHLDRNSFFAAISHFVSLNVILYYPKVLDTVIFVNPQEVVGRISDIVRKSYIIHNEPDQCTLDLSSTKLRDEGIISVSFLEKFDRHYDPSLFTASHLLQIMESRFVVAEIGEGEYLMPSVLQEEPSVAYNTNTSTQSAAPLTILFGTGIAPRGMMCCVTSSCLSTNNPEHLELLPSSSNPGKPACVTRTCVQFKLPFKEPGSLLLMDAFTHFEIHINAPMEVYQHVCPFLRTMFLNKVREVAVTMHYTKLEMEPGFLCENPSAHVESLPWWKRALFSGKAEHSSHTASISERSKCWTCSVAPDKAYGKLEERHTVWLGKVPNPIPRSSSPLLHQLQRIENRQGKVVKVISGVSANWKKLALSLHFSSSVIDAMHIDGHDSADSTYIMFSKWLQGAEGTRAPVEWSTLVQALRESDHASVASELETALQQ